MNIYNPTATRTRQNFTYKLLPNGWSHVHKLSSRFSKFLLIPAKTMVPRSNFQRPLESVFLSVKNIDSRPTTANIIPCWMARPISMTPMCHAHFWSMTNKHKKHSHCRDSAHRPQETIYCRKLDCPGYICATDSVGLVSVNLMQSAAKAAILWK